MAVECLLILIVRGGVLKVYSDSVTVSVRKPKLRFIVGLQVHWQTCAVSLAINVTAWT